MNMDEDLESMRQELETEIAFLRNLFRVTVANNDTREARDEIATRILLASTKLNDLVCSPVGA